MLHFLALALSRLRWILVGTGSVDLGSVGGGIVCVVRQGQCVIGNSLSSFVSSMVVVGPNIQYLCWQAQITLYYAAVPMGELTKLPIVCPPSSDTTLVIQYTSSTRLDLNITGRVPSLKALGTETCGTSRGRLE